MSAAATRPTPPPIAAPCTSATTGFGQAVDRPQHARHLFRVGLVLLARIAPGFSHPGDVRPGAERRAVSRKDDDARLRLLAERDEGLRELANQDVVKRVAHRRPGENDPRDRPSRVSLKRASAPAFVIFRRTE
jgi:hypothetical protein